ncbi:YfbU family protein [Lysobacter sp. K5869]|uniref:YfbU family protein n=1 Tax=Lysobacter sp. K5869 TaxID=2820808 RepID=UPI001C062C27|nr:YfbU family protein [Lysobacter sp. K5869]QWP77524.1 YfbU family protein [Lysobacter sp. K5869]
MKLTNNERLVVAMLASIQRKLGIGEHDDEVDPDFVTSALYHGQEWALIERYAGLFQTEPTPPLIAAIRLHMQMWSALEESYEALPRAERAEVLEQVGASACPPRFPGYDGREEQRFLVATRYLIQYLKEYPNFADRSDFNSGRRMLPQYEAMSEIYREEVGQAAPGHMLSANQIVRLLKAQP